MGSDGTQNQVAVGHLPLSVAIEAALRVADQRRERVFLVGGVVRDLMLGREMGDYDLDLVVEGEGLAFADALGREFNCTIRQHPSFLTAKLLPPFSFSGGDGPLLTELDIATSRSEEYASPGALPTVTAAPIEKDLWRRDFSVNALALPLLDYAKLRAHVMTPEQAIPDIVDPCGGIADLRSKTLRVLHPKSFVDDPTRLFRAVRYAVRLSFDFDLTTVGVMLEAVRGGALKTLSPRRVWNEVLAALDEEHPESVIEEFSARGLFSHLPLVSAERLDEVTQGLERLQQLRAELPPDVYTVAGKLILLAGLIQDNREDILGAVHEGNRVAKRARAVVQAVISGEPPTDIPELVAAYALSGREELRMALESSVEGGGD